MTAKEIKDKYRKGNFVFITHGGFGLATLDDNGRLNTFNHDEVIYKVKSVDTGKIAHYNTLHFLTPKT